MNRVARVPCTIRGQKLLIKHSKVSKMPANDKADKETVTNNMVAISI